MSTPRRAARRADPQHVPSRSVAAPRSARDAACRFLAAQAGRFPDMAIEDPHTAGFDARDAALTHAICDSAVRRWLTLSYLLDRVLDRPLAGLEPSLQGVLLAGAVQLLLLDRIPPHAAINESVEWAKSRVRAGAGGLVNAVLRKIAAFRAPPAGARAAWADSRHMLPLSDGTALPLSGPVLPADTWERLAVATSHPRALIARWREQLGDEAARLIALHDLGAAPTILNVRHARQSLAEDSSSGPHRETGFAVFTGDRAGLVALLGARDDIWVQDPSSARAVQAAPAGGADPRLILDLCAGQGTKTRQLAACFPQARVLATDVDPSRLRTLGQVFRGSDAVRVFQPTDLASVAGDGADLVLADVPCSNTGVLARRAEARYRVGPKALERLGAIQRDILATAAGLLRPGGRLLYSTCSIDRDENQDRAAWASRALGLGLIASEQWLPRGLPSEPAAEYSDGSFWALLAR